MNEFFYGDLPPAVGWVGVECYVEKWRKTCTKVDSFCSSKFHEFSGFKARKNPNIPLWTFNSNCANIPSQTSWNFSFPTQTFHIPFDHAIHHNTADINWTSVVYFQREVIQLYVGQAGVQVRRNHKCFYLCIKYLPKFSRVQRSFFFHLWLVSHSLSLPLSPSKFTSVSFSSELIYHATFKQFSTFPVTDRKRLLGIVHTRAWHSRRWNNVPRQ